MIQIEDGYIKTVPSKWERFFKGCGCAFLVALGLLVGAVIAVLVGVFLNWIPIC